jgi:hypothetical protein
MKRALELIQPYTAMDGVIGIYLVGSATRPYCDERSDLDIEVIVEDALYNRTPMEDRQIFAFKEGEPKTVDYEFYLIPWSDFVNLTKSDLDLFHFPYQHAQILHDPNGRIEPIIKQLAELPEDIRLERMTVHFLECLYSLGRARKTADRGDLPIDLALLRGSAISALVKLIFLAKRSWPSTVHWSEQEFEQMGISDELLNAVKAWLTEPVSDNARAMAGAVRTYLDDCGETFHHDMDGIQQWLLFTKAGKAAFEKWGFR